jgi:hypothetical protein
MRMLVQVVELLWFLIGHLSNRQDRRCAPADATGAYSAEPGLHRETDFWVLTEKRCYLQLICPV